MAAARPAKNERTIIINHAKNTSHELYFLPGWNQSDPNDQNSRVLTEEAIIRAISHFNTPKNQLQQFYVLEVTQDKDTASIMGGNIHVKIADMKGENFSEMSIPKNQIILPSRGSQVSRNMMTMSSLQTDQAEIDFSPNSADYLLIKKMRNYLIINGARKVSMTIPDSKNSTFLLEEKKDEKPMPTIMFEVGKPGSADITESISPTAYYQREEMYCKNIEEELQFYDDKLRLYEEALGKVPVTERTNSVVIEAETHVKFFNNLKNAIATKAKDYKNGIETSQTKYNQFVQEWVKTSEQHDKELRLLRGALLEVLQRTANNALNALISSSPSNQKLISLEKIEAFNLAFAGVAQLVESPVDNELTMEYEKVNLNKPGMNELVAYVLQRCKQIDLEFKTDEGTFLENSFIRNLEIAKIELGQKNQQFEKIISNFLKNLGHQTQATPPEIAIRRLNENSLNQKQSILEGIRKLNSSSPQPLDYKTVSQLEEEKTKIYSYGNPGSTDEKSNSPKTVGLKKMIGKVTTYTEKVKNFLENEIAWKSLLDSSAQAVNIQLAKAEQSFKSFATDNDAEEKKPDLVTVSQVQDILKQTSHLLLVKATELTEAKHKADVEMAMLGAESKSLEVGVDTGIKRRASSLSIFSRRDSIVTTRSSDSSEDMFGNNSTPKNITRKQNGNKKISAEDKRKNEIAIIANQIENQASIFSTTYKVRIEAYQTSLNLMKDVIEIEEKLLGSINNITRKLSPEKIGEIIDDKCISPLQHAYQVACANLESSCKLIEIYPDLIQSIQAFLINHNPEKLKAKLNDALNRANQELAFSKVTKFHKEISELVKESKENLSKLDIYLKEINKHEVKGFNDDHLDFVNELNEFKTAQGIESCQVLLTEDGFKNFLNKSSDEEKLNELLLSSDFDENLFPNAALSRNIIINETRNSFQSFMEGSGNKIFKLIKGISEKENLCKAQGKLKSKMEKTVDLYKTILDYLSLARMEVPQLGTIMDQVEKEINSKNTDKSRTSTTSSASKAAKLSVQSDPRQLHNASADSKESKLSVDSNRPMLLPDQSEPMIFIKALSKKLDEILGKNLSKFKGYPPKILHFYCGIKMLTLLNLKNAPLLTVEHPATQAEAIKKIIDLGKEFIRREVINKYGDIHQNLAHITLETKSLCESCNKTLSYLQDLELKGDKNVSSVKNLLKEQKQLEDKMKNVDALNKSSEVRFIEMGNFINDYYIGKDRIELIRISDDALKAVQEKINLARTELTKMKHSILKTYNQFKTLQKYQEYHLIVNCVHLAIIGRDQSSPLIKNFKDRFTISKESSHSRVDVSYDKFKVSDQPNKDHELIFHQIMSLVKEFKDINDIRDPNIKHFVIGIKSLSSSDIRSSQEVLGRINDALKTNQSYQCFTIICDIGKEYLENMLKLETEQPGVSVKKHP